MITVYLGAQKFVGPPTLFQYRMLQFGCVLGSTVLLIVLCLQISDWIKHGFKKVR
jgi:hypothetical protein